MYLGTGFHLCEETRVFVAAPKGRRGSLGALSTNEQECTFLKGTCGVKAEATVLCHEGAM
jgi:hypothetical protein